MVISEKCFRCVPFFNNMFFYVFTSVISKRKDVLAVDKKYAGQPHAQFLIGEAWTRRFCFLKLSSDNSLGLMAQRVINEFTNVKKQKPKATLWLNENWEAVEVGFQLLYFS